ncbi:MAG: hypothetical protein M9939_04910 [Mesorhizobium sp.]|nr:hypothetical protein [Mesorhizobium sp.]MCO5160452.1 hypothetical protein [Mesorhizobium sp.]
MTLGFVVGRRLNPGPTGPDADIRPDGAPSTVCGAFPICALPASASNNTAPIAIEAILVGRDNLVILPSWVRYL